MRHTIKGQHNTVLGAQGSGLVNVGRLLGYQAGATCALLPVELEKRTRNRIAHTLAKCLPGIVGDASAGQKSAAGRRLHGWIPLCLLQIKTRGRSEERRGGKECVRKG